MRTMFVAAAAAVILAGCNTVEGFGHDMAAVGNAVAGAANDAKGDGRPKARAASKTTKTTRTAQAKCTGPRSKDTSNKC